MRLSQVAVETFAERKEFLEKENKRLREALEEYADKDRWFRASGDEFGKYYKFEFVGRSGAGIAIAALGKDKE